MKILKFVAIVIALFPGIVFADYTVTSTSMTDGIITIASGEWERAAQELPITGEGTIQNVEFCLYNSGSPTGDVIMSIQGDSGGNPDGSTIASATLNATSFDSSHVRRTFSLASPLSMTSSTDYWIVITRSTMDGGGVVPCGDASAGAGGRGYNGSWNTLSGRDFNISVLVTEGSPTPPSPSMSTSTPVDNPNQNIFNMIILFMGSMWFVVWSLRKN